ncbi:hypothetical protein RSAG8_09173, partial [Rhizoctonia solani AG-8 WAC10335]
MVKFALAATFFALSSVVSASPAPAKAEVNLEKRFNVLSGQWDTENIGLNKKLNAIGKIPTTWRWTYNAASTALIADVSYDLWLSNVPNSGTGSKDTTFEVMIWLSNRRAGPAGSKVATANINGLNWGLFKGRVGTWDVYSFVAPSELSNYNADLKPFLTHLINSRGISSNQYLVALQAGTEPFEGSGTLTTTAYTAAIN